MSSREEALRERLEVAIRDVVRELNEWHPDPTAAFAGNSPGGHVYHALQEALYPDPTESTGRVTYYDTLRGMTDDPDLLAAVDAAERRGPVKRHP